jgi:hypothetical protein
MENPWNGEAALHDVFENLHVHAYSLTYRNTYYHNLIEPSLIQFGERLVDNYSYCW